MKKILGILLTICMVITLMPIVTWADTVTNVSTAQELKNALQADGNIRLTANIDSAEAFSIWDANSPTLDLNGFYIKSTDPNRACIFWSDDSTLTITGSGIVESAGSNALYVDKGTVKIYDVEFRGGSNSNEGFSAVAVYTGNVEIYGGKFIGGNHTNNSGGSGLFVCGDPSTVHSNVAIYGGNFFGGSGVDRGYGVFKKDASAVITINGGTFTGGCGNAVDGVVAIGGSKAVNAGTSSANAVTIDTATAPTISTFVRVTDELTVNFNSTSGSAIEPVTGVTSGEIINVPAAPTLSGYTMEGWYKEPELINKWDFDTDTVTANITLYANWTVNSNPGNTGGSSHRSGGSTTTTPTTLPTSEAESVSPNAIGNFPFTDVPDNAWYYGDVAYAYVNGLFSGTTETTFSPNAPMTRAMLWTSLACFAGVQTEQSTNVKYYDAARDWAMGNGLTDGTSPNGQITREQLVTTLYRYAKLKNMDVSVGENTNILSYTDAQDVAEYAIPAMQWACGEQIVQGSKGALTPKANSSRAQVAAMLHRFDTSIEK